jgi:diaminopimelate epimerase
MLNMRGLKFSKYQGLGNDFVILDFIAEQSLSITPRDVVRISDRRFGIGCDQVLVLRKPQGKAGARMEIFNSDGSIAEMCGNGIRAAAIYLHRHHEAKARYEIETLAGLMSVEVKGNQVAVDMGKPVQGKPEGEELAVGKQGFRFHEVSMGNPHAVIFTEHADKIPLETLGPQIETHSRFPQRTNVEFVEVTGPSSISVRVWERGAGATLACGTGACAAAVATIALGKAKSPLQVHLPGGVLAIAWEPGKSVVMEGPAEEVFRGEYLVRD